jgi:hypothetical protein
VRGDLKPGEQLAQAAHGLARYALSHIDKLKSWAYDSEYICILAAPNEARLASLLEQAIERNIAHSFFREPDMDNSLTAIVLDAVEDSRKLCSQFPLALKEKK